MVGFFDDVNSKGEPRKRGPKKGELTLSDDEREVLEQLKHFTWPKGSSQFLAAAVRTSMRNYKRFYKKFKRVLKESKRDFPDGVETKNGKSTFNDLHEFIQHKLASSFLSPVSYIYCYFESYHSKVCHWRQWNGKLKPFNVQSKEFQSEGLDIATEYSGNSGVKLWKAFMETMNEG